MFVVLHIRLPSARLSKHRQEIEAQGCPNRAAHHPVARRHLSDGIYPSAIAVQHQHLVISSILVPEPLNDEWRRVTLAELVDPATIFLAPQNG